MAKGEKNVTVKKKDTVTDIIETLFGFSSGVFGGLYVDVVPHEVAHMAVIEALGYDSKMHLSFVDTPLVVIIGDPNSLEHLLIHAAGPIASGIVSIASLLAFLKLKKSLLKDVVGGVVVRSSFNHVAYALNQNHRSIFVGDYGRMALSLEELGYGKIGEALPVLPLAVLAYCSYNVGKHYLSAYKDYKKSKATLQTDKSLEKVISDNVFVKDNSTQK